mmetsp:Transcript_45147/g.88622  ORF Transcript_45147/g.88622 Transcript_45147/m.88622 type:complete len:247 (+) Transcript_45147:882-1622(+)
MMPLVIRQFRVGAAMASMRPELMELNEELKRKKETQEATTEMMEEHKNKTQAVFKKYGANPLSALVTPLVSGPIFMTFFFTLRSIGARYPEVSMEGALWFPDLGAMDPYYVLPILSGATFLAVIELGTEGGQSSQQMSPMMKNAFRGIACTTPLFVYSFPSGVFMYWISSNVYSLLQGKVLRSPWGRKTFNIPDTVVPKEEKNPYLKKKVKKPKKDTVAEPAVQTVQYFSDEAGKIGQGKRKTRRR